MSNLSLLYKIGIALAFILLIVVVVWAYSSSNKKVQTRILPSPNAFLLGCYLIDPENRMVFHQQYFEEDRGRGKRRIHSWGYRYVADTTIDFNTTCLRVTDTQFAFSEYYKPANDTVTAPVVRGKHDIEGYTYLNGFYEKDGLYFRLISLDPLKFDQLIVPEGVDFGKLTAVPDSPHSISQYYYNSEGLYYYDSYYKHEIVKVASAKNCTPVITPYYCAYNGMAYQKDKPIAKLSQLKTIDIKRDGSRVCLTDGKTVFDVGRGIRSRELDGVDKWIQLTTGEEVLVASNCAYIATAHVNGVNAGEVKFTKDIFFATSDGIISIDDCLSKEPQRYDKAYIYNGDKGTVEELDVNEYKLYIPGFHSYRGTCYYNGNMLANDFDMDKLQRLEDGWLCDGKYLTHKDFLSSTDGVSRRLVFNPCVQFADASRLQFVNRHLLVDGVNFYALSLNGRELKVIPFEKLGVKVEVKSVNYAYIPLDL